jgi:3-oxoacyl-[acyl-carrier-protein] synthase II
MKRVVVTGLGMLSPVGNTVESGWTALTNGKSGIGRITKFDPSEYKTQIAGELKDFSPEPVITAKESRRLDLFSQYGIVATDAAVRQSGIEFGDMDPFRAGVIVGTGIGGINVLENQVENYLNKGPGRVSAFYITGMITNIVTGHIAMRYGIKGPNYVTTSACASGCHAIGNAYYAIQRGEADVILAGGTEGAITPTAVAGFINIMALSRRNDAPERASRPFDCGRDGFVMGEGAGVVVLEELEHAKKRGATIYAEMSGSGFTADAYHVTAPDPDGAGASRSIELAVEHAGMNLQDVDYVNCHGTSTPAGDIAETNAIKRAFGDHAYNLSISSTKSMTGHLLGAAGAIEFVATVLSVYNNVIPPTINVEDPDPECDLDCTPNTAKEKELNFALSNSFGFGGQNATLAVKKFRG